MGTAQEHSPVLLILAAFSRHDRALDWARQRSETEWGQIVFSSDIVPFDYTSYYEATMGGGLKKVLWAYEALIDPTQLVGIKHRTNEWEHEYRQAAHGPEPRPLNLDPGYVTEAKLILATTKDRNHRIYLGRGIFAEVTLHYRRGGVWSGHPWTYADYRSEVYHDFLTQCRRYLRRRNRAI